MRFNRWRHRATNRNPKTVRRNRFPLLLEQLETRELLSVALVPEGPAFVPGAPGSSVEFRKANFNLATSLAQADYLFGLPATDPGIAARAFDNGVATINYMDTASGNLFPNPRDVSSTGNAFGGGSLADTVQGSFNGPNAEDDNFSMKASGYIYFPTAGDWNLTVRSDDGFRLVMGENNVTVATFDGGRGPDNTTGQAYVPTAGYYRYELTWDQGFAGAMCEFFANGPGQPADTLVGDPAGALSVVQSAAGGTAGYGTFATPSPSPTPGGSGHSVEFRQASYGLDNTLAQADQLFTLDPSNPGVAAQAFDNGVATINYLDTGSTAYLFPNPRDVGSTGNAYGGGSLAVTTKGSFLPNAEDDNFVMKSSGYLYVPTAGTWNFTVASDDGFQLVLGDNDATVAEFDGGRFLAPSSGSAYLPAPGYYPYTLTWYQGNIGAGAAFSYNGPGQPTNTLVGAPGPIQVFQAPPQSVDPLPASAVGIGPGFQVEFRKTSTLVGDLSTADQLLAAPAGSPSITAQATDNGVATINYLDNGGTASLFPNPRDVGSGTLTTTLGHFFNANEVGDEGTLGEDDNFAMRASGYLYIPRAGTWAFTVASDDGFQLQLGSNNATVGLFDGGRFLAPTTMYVDVPAAGLYPFQLTWYQGILGAAVAFSAHGPGQPNDMLVGDPAGTLQVFQSIAPPVATVDPAFTGPAGSHPAGRPDLTIGLDAFSSIQAGINAVTAGGTVNVDAGTYAENVTLAGPVTVQVNGAVTLDGNLTITGGAWDAHAPVTVAGLAGISNDTYLADAGVQMFAGGLSLTGATLQTTGTASTLLGGDVATGASSTTSTIDGGLDLGTSPRTFTVAAGTAPDGVDLSVTGAVTGGSAGLVKAGGGTLALAGANTYGGDTTVNGGALLLTGSLQPAGGRVLLNGSGVVLAGGGTVNGREVVVTSAGTGVTVQNLSVLNNASGAGVLVQAGGSVQLLGDVIQGNHIGVEVNGGTALLQGDDLSNNTAGAGAAGLQVENGAVVDAGQTAGSPYGNITGLGVSSGGNVFHGYTAAYVGGPLDPTVAAQAIRDLNTGGAYSNPWPQLGKYDLPAENNDFGVTTLGAIENLVYHDLDNPALGFVSYGAAGVQAHVVPGSLIYYAATPADGGQFTAAGVQRSVIRYIQVSFDGFVYLDPAHNFGLDLVKVNGPGGARPGTLIHASLFRQTFDPATGTYTVVYAFSGSGTQYGSLEDGNYNLQFFGAAVEGGGPGGAGLATAVNQNFFRYFGDLNGDGRVDVKDLQIILRSLRSPAEQARVLAALDFDNNGTLDFLDLAEFALHYGTRLNPNGTVSHVPPGEPHSHKHHHPKGR